MTEKREQRGWYWHCRACDRYVPREESRCTCGAAKVRRSTPPAGDRAPGRELFWEMGAVTLLGGLGLLWLLLE
jgi:hypothetical protein